MSARIDRLVLALGALTWAAAPAGAQSLLYARTGDKLNDRLGACVRNAGDVNQDGRPDVVAGAPEDGNVFGQGEGFVRLYDGATGATIRTINGEGVGDFFGNSVDGAGDVDNDGRADVVVGAPLHSSLGNARGRVYVFSGATGQAIHTIDGLVNNERLGLVVAGIGDVNSDGRPDFLAASRDAPAGGTQRGLVRIFSGLTGLALHTIQGASNGERLGLAADGIGGDVNGDGRPDIVVGSLTAGVRVYSGLNWQVLRTFPAPSFDDVFGAAVGGIGDVTGDGVRDVLIGATQDSNVFNIGPGYVRVYDGVTSALVRTFTGGAAGDRFGIACADARDLTGDGVPEVLVGAEQPGGGAPGYARVFRVSTGTVLATFTGQVDGDQLGISVDGLGDVDGDGDAELVLGEPGHTTSFQLDGRIEVWTNVFSGCAAPYTYCLVTNNSTGQPALIASTGSVSIAANDFALTCTGLPPSTNGLFYYGPTEIATPFGNGYRCVGGTVFRLGVQQASSGGVMTRAIDYGNLPAGGAIAAGSTWKFQCWYRNSLGGGAGFNLSNGLSATFCN